MTDLEMAVSALLGKQRPYATLYDYYLGRQPLAYTSERLREVFRRLDTRFSENLCALVVNSVGDKLTLKGITVKGRADAQAQIDGIFGSVNLELIAEDVHEGTLVTGESYLIVWKDDEGKVQGFYNDPRMCHVFYDAENPYETRVAAKMYVMDDGKVNLILYYADHLEYYVTRSKVGAASELTAKRFELTDEKENPYKAIPVFQFRLHRDVRSELADVIPLQDAANKLLSDMLVVAEFGAFRQRWVISNSDTTQLKNAPNEIWSIPAGDGTGQQTQVGDLAPTDLLGYLNAIDKLATAIGVISRTPKHFLYGQGGDPSGEALIAAEAPLNRKASDYISRLTPTWKQALSFALTLMGTPVDPSAITLQYERPETVQPLTTSLIRQNSVTAGIPLVTTLRREGWSETEIEQMEEDRAAESEAQTQSLGAALARAQRTFDQGGVAQTTAGAQNAGGPPIKAPPAGQA